MTVRYRALGCAWGVAASLAMAACASNPPKPADAKMTLVATADVNPDLSGRASPIVVRIYQLKSDAAFKNAEFTAVYGDEQKALAAELISREEFVLAPSERRPLQLKVAPEAKFIGVLGAYRDIRNAQWRVLVPTPLKKDATVSVERARILVTLAN